ncbi:MAG: DNA-binding protein [Gammaproteobacteria bacterium]|nr:MAG: DNA-binding protein [Gammaproteobacteria bacterium]
MQQKLPIEIDPFRLAKSGLELEGSLALPSMPRLSGLLLENTGEVSIKMNFDTDVLGTPMMQGVFTAPVSLMCERCSMPMTYDLKVECLLGLIKIETQVEGLAEQYEPWIIEGDDPIRLSAVVEDELILALPLIPKHAHACLPKEAWSSGEEIEESESEEKVSPFAVLAALKKD